MWKRMLLKCSITMIFICLLVFLCKIPNAFRKNDNMVVFPVPFHIFIPLTKGQEKSIEDRESLHRLNVDLTLKDKPDYHFHCDSF